MKGHSAFYAAPFDLCTVNRERATHQLGRVYACWVTSRVAGPVKGVPGSKWW